MNKISIRFLGVTFAMLMILGAAGCGAEPSPPAPTEPACPPRSISDPARLTIGSSAENFGVAPPCEAALQFSIARNTDLRGLEGSVQIADADGNAAGEASLSVSLDGPVGGMFRAEVDLTRVAEQSCRRTSLNLVIERCLNAAGAEIQCPEIRVRPSQVLMRLEATGADVSVCYDD